MLYLITFALGMLLLDSSLNRSYVFFDNKYIKDKLKKGLKAGGYIYVIWHSIYKKEMNTLYTQALKNNITLSQEEIDNVINKINAKAKVFERILSILVLFLGFLSFIALGSAQSPISYFSHIEIETTKYSLLPIQDESILIDQLYKTYYIAENVNKSNSYTFFCGNEKNPEKIEIVSDNVIKYENINCEPYIVKETKISVVEYALLQKILFFRLNDHVILEENYKFYVPKENYIKTFSY